MSALEETTMTGVVFAEQSLAATAEEMAEYFTNEHQVHRENMGAMRVTPEDLNAFLELVYAADADYMATEGYLPEPAAAMVDWGDVSRALMESQMILVKMQELLSETLAEMGIGDHDSIRVYADGEGDMRLVVDHPRQREIEEMLNSPRQKPLRDMYRAATAGMSAAGGLVGVVSAPAEVLAQVQEERSRALAG